MSATEQDREHAAACLTGDIDYYATRDRIADALAAERRRTLLNFADLIDRGPTFPMPPSILSAMARERADGDGAV